jgi:hypothetical protein
MPESRETDPVDKEGTISEDITCLDVITIEDDHNKENDGILDHNMHGSTTQSSYCWFLPTVLDHNMVIFQTRPL